jgi:alpha-D-xyloside xylohydrolase
MKFTDGYWLNREQFLIENPREIYDARAPAGGKELTAYAIYRKIVERGNKLNIGNTMLRCHSPLPGVIGITLTHFDADDKNPRYELRP